MDTPQETNVWERLQGEPERWHTIFVKYYLAQGPGRSLRVAYLNFIRDTRPDVDTFLLSSKTPYPWVNVALKWQWFDRAKAWETEQSRLAMASVEHASRKLRELSLRAVETLELNLLSTRLGVQAAKEILDRAGLPAVTRVESANTISFTADELAKARQEAEEWEKMNRKENG